MPSVILPVKLAAASYTDISAITDAVTNEFSVSAITSIIAGIVGGSIGLVFLWWAVRKSIKALKAAATRGKLRV